MNISIRTRFLAFALVMMLAFGFSLTTVFADEHEEDDTTAVHDEHEEGDEHDEHEDGDESDLIELTSHSDSDTSRISQLETLIVLLTQLVELLQQQSESSHHQEAVESHDHADESEDHDHGDEGTSDELAVWIEIHSNQTHAHVQEPNKEADSFVIEGLSYTEEEAIIATIAEVTGLSVDAIAAVITFPSGELDEHGDSTGEHDEDADLEGIHIMTDGKVMYGTGEEVPGATITDDGMVMLSDGDIIEPAFDLR